MFNSSLLLNNNVCLNYLPVYIEGNVICADNKTLITTVIWIVSWGSRCAMLKSQGSNPNVSPQISWIHDVLKKKDSNTSLNIIRLDIPKIRLKISLPMIYDYSNCQESILPTVVILPIINYHTSCWEI